MPRKEGSRLAGVRVALKYPFVKFKAETRLRRHRLGTATVHLVRLEDDEIDLRVLQKLCTHYLSQGVRVYITDFKDGTRALSVG